MKALLWIFLSLQCVAQYSLVDLRFLADERSYEEFFRHAQDVRPAQRGEAWQKMVQSMGQAYLQKHLSLEIYPKRAYEVVGQISSWPILYRDDEFQKLRGQFGQKYFAQCLEDGPSSPCLKEASLFYGRGRKTPRESLAMVELLHELVPHLAPTHAFTYAKTLLSKKGRGQHCRTPIIQLALMDELTRTGPFKLSALKAWKKEHLSATCLEHMAEGLKRELRARNFTRAAQAFDLLYVSDLLTPREKNFFLTRTYLQKIEKGERLNLAWNSLDALAENFSLRQSVLARLKTLDPLPDQLFGLRPSRRKDVLMRHLTQNFPEYMDLYSENCLNYLRGKGKFPDGNPTVHCRQIMEEAPGKNWVNSQKLAKYREIKIAPTPAK